MEAGRQVESLTETCEHTIRVHADSHDEDFNRSCTPMSHDSVSCMALITSVSHALKRPDSIAPAASQESTT